MVLSVNTAISYDSHRYIKRLTQCGFTEQQAETLADGQLLQLNSIYVAKTDISEVLASVEALRLETKSEIARLETAIETLRLETKSELTELKTGIETLRLETKSDIEGLRKDTFAGIEGLRKETIAGIEGLRKETIAGIATLKADLIKWMFGAFGLTFGVFFTVMQFMS